MKFGPVAVAHAQGAILAHSVNVGGLRLKKSTRLGESEVAELRGAGVETVLVARLDGDDIGEDEAATRLADALRPSGLEIKPAATGRVNIHAPAAGVFTVRRGVIDAINRNDPAITVATLADYSRVAAGQMVATVKIIPYAVPRAQVEAAATFCADGTVLRLHPFTPTIVGLLQTTLPGTKPSVLDKTARVMRDRLSRSGSGIGVERRVPHDIPALAGAIRDIAERSGLIVIFGASATSDPDDVVPAAIRAAGGTVRRVGMPVDPGNLLVWGDLGSTMVLGAPGCARSPKENGFDWVLDRLLSGAGLSDEAIAGMGVGGLLMEIPTRPQPREPAGKRFAGRVDAVVLAAGRSSRMGGPNKLLATFGGVPLVRRTVEAVSGSDIDHIVVVTGHQGAAIEAVLDGSAVGMVHNADFAGGLSTSLKAGIAAIPPEADGVLVVLADMPAIATSDINVLVHAFRKAGGKAAVRASHDGRRGNPVLLPRALFPAVAKLEGDVGAKPLLESGDVEVIDVEIGVAASTDVDTPEAMARAGGTLMS